MVTHSVGLILWQKRLGSMLMALAGLWWQLDVDNHIFPVIMDILV